MAKPRGPEQRPPAGFAALGGTPEDIEDVFCPVCGKLTFDTESAADAYVERRKRQTRHKGDKRVLQRSYRDRTCRRWHVTSNK